MVAEKHCSIRSATAGRSRKMLSGRMCGCACASSCAGRVMDAMLRIIARGVGFGCGELYNGGSVG